MTFMNHLIFLDAQADELGKILSGMKSMVMKELDPAQAEAHPINPGDSLYFLRNKDECALRVKATVVRVLSFTNSTEEDLSHTLKEQQPRLQLTEAQYNTWSVKKQVQLVEFACAHKVDVIYVAAHKISRRSDWMAFEQFSLITESHEQ
jgi:hypothetical protein